MRLLRPLLPEEAATEEAFRNEHEERDQLREEDAAPEWVREWYGPFEVEIEGALPWAEEAEA